VRLEIQADIGILSALTGTVRGVRRIGDFSSVGVSVGVIPSRGGLFISFSWSRLGQSIILPVVLVPQEEVTSAALFWAIAIPWATYAAVEFVIMRPRSQRKRQRLLERKRRELKENVAKRRIEAEQAVQLMRPLVENRQAFERENGGLVILNATYGVRIAGPGGKMTWEAGEVADVTEALAALVDGSQLSLPRGVRISQIMGFYDPAPLKKKSLSVLYLFDGKQHYVEIRGGEALSIPMRAHEVDE